GNTPVAAFADDQAALEIEGRAVALAGLAAHDLWRLARQQPEQQAPADIDEIIKAVGVPRRAFGEDEVCCQTFRRTRFQDVVECRHRRPSHRARLPPRGYSRPGGVSISRSPSGALHPIWKSAPPVVTAKTGRFIGPGLGFAPIAYYKFIDIRCLKAGG